MWKSGSILIGVGRMFCGTFGNINDQWVGLEKYAFSLPYKCIWWENHTSHTWLQFPCNCMVYYAISLSWYWKYVYTLSSIAKRTLFSQRQREKAKTHTWETDWKFQFHTRPSCRSLSISSILPPLLFLFLFCLILSVQLLLLCCPFFLFLLCSRNSYLIYFSTIFQIL